MSLHRLMLSTAIALPLLAASAVVGAKSKAPEIDYEQMAGATVAFIEQRNMDRFDQVDDHHMVVWARRDQAYLVTFESSCRRYTLEDPMVIERTSNFRLYPEDRITINGAPCLIRDIRILDVPAVKAARATAER